MTEFDALIDLVTARLLALCPHLDLGTAGAVASGFVLARIPAALALA